LINILSFTFSGDKFYRDRTVVPTGTAGLAFLCGKNHDGSTDNLSNGAGKTRLFQVLEGFIFGTTDRGKFKRMVLPNFEGELLFEDTRTKIVWSFTYRAKDNKWTVLENGTERTISHKASDCQAFLQHCIGFTRDEWNYFVAINQNSIRIMLKGKPAERRLYLENFFNIDVFYTEKKEEYDANVKTLETEIGLLNMAKARLDQVKSARSSMPNDGWLETQLALIRASIPWLRQQQQIVIADVSDTDNKLSVWNEYQQLFDLFSSSTHRPTSQAMQKELETLFQAQAQIREAIDARKKFQRLRDCELVPHEQKRPVPPPSMPAEEEPNSKTLTEKGMAVSQMREKIKTKKRLQEITTMLEEFDFPAQSKDDYQTEADQLVKQLAELSFHINLLEEGGEHGVCPKCGQTLPSMTEAKDVESAIELLQTHKAARKKDLDAANNGIRQHLEYETLEEKQADLQRTFDAYPKFGTKLSIAEDELTALNKLSEQWKLWRTVSKQFDDWQAKHNTIMAQINALGDPSCFEQDFTEEEQHLTKEISELQLGLKNVTRLEELSNSLADSPPRSKLEQTLALLQEEYQEWEQRIEALNIMKGDLTGKLDIVRGYEKDIVELEGQLENYENIQREFRIVTGLAKFFSPTGFKIYELKKRCGLLIDRANYWSSIFFQEPYEWSLPSDIDDLDFLVRPVNHKEEEPYPAGSLSGGESNRASRVLLFSQLQLMPPNKAINLLVVDEIEDKLDEAGMVAFTDEVVPKLKETFPSRTIVLVSHQKGLKTSDAIDHLWLAERKDRKTVLKVFPFYNRRKEITHE
jgi:DNA repair exonuclease SbcCD ATPase subunit